MDFLVVGLGLGALAILGGIVMVTLIAWRSERAARRATRLEDQRYHVASAAARNAAGQALIAAGAMILLATVGAIAGSLDDRTGSLLVATTATVAAIGLVVRDFLYRARNPMPRRPRTRPLETPVATSPTRTGPLSAGQAVVSSRADSSDVEPAPGEAVAARGVEPMLETTSHEPEEAPDEAEAPIAGAEHASLPDAAADVPGEGEAEGVIDASYSFMRDDDPAAGERTVPYSFMPADDSEHASGETGASNGAKEDFDEAAAIVAAPPMNDSPGGGKTSKARPTLRLVGKGRSQRP